MSESQSSNMRPRVAHIVPRRGAGRSDLQRPVSGSARPIRSCPHFGGAVANVAIVAARPGAAGGARGRRRARRLGPMAARPARGRGRRRVVVQADRGPPDAARGRQRRRRRGADLPDLRRDDRDRRPRAAATGVEQAVDDSAALFISSNTLVGAEEREVTMRARELALERGRPVIFDPNLRLHRWRSKADAAASANACVPGALLVRANEAEAALMTGEDDPERAATALLKAGAQDGRDHARRARRDAARRAARRCPRRAGRGCAQHDRRRRRARPGCCSARLAVTGSIRAAVAAAAAAMRWRRRRGRASVGGP